MITIRPYTSADAKALTDLFHETINTVGLLHYSEAQVRAWAPYPIDYEHWQQRFDNYKPLVAEVNGSFAGFMSLEDDGLIRWAFTHKDHQRKGVASALFQAIEQLAIDKGIDKLRSEASFFAHPFFVKKGFETIKQNSVEIRGEFLTNFSVEKRISN